MAAVVMEGVFPVRYESWRDWRLQKIADAREKAHMPLVEQRTAPCGYCWGQRRILAPAANGEGLVPRACPSCGGTGRTPIA